LIEGGLLRFGAVYLSRFVLLEPVAEGIVDAGLPATPCGFEGGKNVVVKT